MFTRRICWVFFFNVFIRNQLFVITARTESCAQCAGRCTQRDEFAGHDSRAQEEKEGGEGDSTITCRCWGLRWQRRGGGGRVGSYLTLSCVGIRSGICAGIRIPCAGMIGLQTVG